MRVFGTAGVKTVSIALLAVSSALLLFPLVRILRESGISENSEKPLLITILLFHIIATLFFLPPEDLVNRRPVVTLDHAIHYYQVKRAAEIFPQTGRLNCYDPYFMAGHPGGVLFDIDSKGVELYCSVIPFIPIEWAYKSFIFLGYAIFVFTFYFACRRFGYDIEEAVYALLAALIVWHWGRPYIGAFRYAGMFAYITVSHVSLYISSLLRPFLKGGVQKRFYILGPLSFFLHPTAAVLLPVPFISTFIGEVRKLRIRNVLKFAGWCVLVLAVNAIWLLPVMRYLDLKVASETFFQLKGLGALSRLLFKAGNLPAILILLFSAAGFIRIAGEGRIREVIPHAAGSVFLFLISSFGTVIPLINQMEPGRFLVPAIIFAAPLSGAGIKFTLTKLNSLLTEGPVSGRLKITVVAAALVITPLMAAVSAREYYRHTLCTSHPPEVSELISALKEYTVPGARLMFQDGMPVRYGHCYLSSIIPLYTGVEQIGGPYPHMFMKHIFTNFTEESTMGSDLQQIEAETMQDYLDLYNVRWILTASGRTEFYFSNFPGLEKVWSSEHFTLRKRTGYKRAVRTASEYNLIRVSIPEKGELPEKLLLEYHWARSLNVDPPARIEPQLRLDDPVPLILLHTGGKRDIEIFSR